MTERVLVTGISGFIALHVAAELLRAGKRVRGTVRSLARADEVRQALDEGRFEAFRAQFHADRQRGLEP
jgi:nucleoside-diphosphate-sugar epimerase